MVRKIILSIFFCISIFAWSTLKSQDNTNTEPLFKIGLFNSTEILNMLPAKITAQAAINELNQKYKDELLLMQNDYAKKYSNFMDNQSSMSENIKLRRMQELNELEQNINKFMKIAQEDIESQEQQQIEPLKEKLKVALQTIGTTYNFTCIYDTANESIAFITPNAIDITPLLKKQLNIK